MEGSTLDTPPQGLEWCEPSSHWLKSIGSADIQNQVLPERDLTTFKIDQGERKNNVAEYSAFGSFMVFHQTK